MSGDIAAPSAPPAANETDAISALSERAELRRLNRQLQLAGVELMAPIGGASGGGCDVPIAAAAGNGDLPAADVMPQCPLLSTETATAVLPALEIQVPAESSWPVMRLDVTRFADSDGNLLETALEQALQSCVDLGDVLHDTVNWPTQAMRQDAWLNRRLAIQVTGFGDLVELRKLDPCSVTALNDLDELLHWVRATLQGRSRLLAKTLGPLPAIEQSDPSRMLSCAVAREDWRQRWRHTADETAVRHRNLLVLSPWSIFPAGSRADFRYADLLPVLLHADACAAQRSVSLSHWNAREFKHFKQRAWAVLQHRCAATRIAKGD